MPIPYHSILFHALYANSLSFHIISCFICQFLQASKHALLRCTARIWCTASNARIRRNARTHWDVRTARAGWSAWICKWWDARNAGVRWGARTRWDGAWPPRVRRDVARCSRIRGCGADCVWAVLWARARLCGENTVGTSRASVPHSAAHTS